MKQLNEFQNKTNQVILSNRKVVMRRFHNANIWTERKLTQSVPLYLLRPDFYGLLVTGLMGLHSKE